ncbi:hypothetical protein GCM10009868_24690 [Terrabacter aerolatus]|uniref:UspA domain-containing protein n=1 Tax=Terrabacter aerolatus TaxID=422442 RepID=A0A512D1D3_9MICO|nr:hypothetical protein [Terrabacter aerolatus]GEO30266.1 hypothetical protein TAE01_20760 [Terrabacter aerolatus]
MTEPTADVPTAPARDDLTAAPSEQPHQTVQPVQDELGAPAEQGEAADSGPTPAIIVLTEEALKPVDVDKIIGLHEDEAPTYRVLVPADTDRNLLSSFLNHLSLFEMREALESLRPVDRSEAHADADTALSSTLAEFERHAVAATGEITADDPMPTLVEEVARLGAQEVVVVTEPHAVEDTFHTDWASRARETLGVPVLHMYAGDWRLG